MWQSLLGGEGGEWKIPCALRKVKGSIHTAGLLNAQVRGEEGGEQLCLGSGGKRLGSG